MKSAIASLPFGYWRDGVYYREAVLRQLTGTDELSLCEDAWAEPTASRVTELLARCLMRLGPLTAVTAEHARALTIGDREALLLQLRRLTYGERLDCVLTCPAEGCGERMDVALNASDLLLAPYDNAQPRYEKLCGQYRVTFRMPVGADQEAVVAMARTDARQAARALLERCVEHVTDENELPVAELPPAAAEQLGEWLAELDPQAELKLNLTCPVCGHPFAVLFDTATFFLQEIERRGARLYREIHTLALHYHWREADVLRMSAARRHTYLEMLAETDGLRRRQ